MEKGKNRQVFAALILLLVLGTVFFCFWAEKKQVWFCDEIYSYESANGFEQNWPATYVDTWMSGEDVEKFFSADWDSLSLKEVSNRLYNDHVPLYFWIFRIVSFFLFKGSGSVWIGLSINLFFYLSVLMLGYGLFVKLTGKPLLSGAVMLAMGVVNCLMMEQALILRMYVMLLWMEITLVLGGLWILESVRKGKLSPVAFGYLFPVSLMGFLTHYDYWIFYGITAACFCLWLLIAAIHKSGKVFWRSMEFKTVLAWVGNFAASLLTTILLFPYSRWNLNTGKGEMAISSLFDFSGEKLDQILWGFERLSAAVLGERFPMTAGLLILFGCIVAGVVILFRKKEISKLVGLILIVLISLGYQLVVCFTFPTLWEERYLWGTFTLLAWCAAYGAILVLQAVLGFIKQEKSRKICGIILTVGLSLGMMAGQVRMMDGGNGIVYLFHPDKDVAVLEENSDLPWLVYGPAEDAYSYFDWLMAEEICFLTMANTAEDGAAIARLQEEGQFVLYSYEAQFEQILPFLEQELSRDLTAEVLTTSTNYTVYLVGDVK